MKLFSYREQRLCIVVAICSLVVTAISLCLTTETVPPFTAEQSSPISLSPTVTARRRPTRSLDRNTPLRTINPNFASFEELVAVPGVGPALARNILAHREGNIFFAAEDMIRVRGIGETNWQKMAPYFTFASTEHSVGETR